MQTVTLGGVEFSRLIMGGNPFSGFSHQNPQRDREMVRYYTVDRIKETLRKAEAAGINTLVGRSDNHIKRLLWEYWDEGGQIQWIAQTASELGDQLRAVRDAARAGAKGVFIHGGIVDFWFAQGKTDMLAAALEQMRECEVVGGFAGHAMEANTWIRDHLEPDFQMCCYYDPSPRADSPHHVGGHQERWDEGRRQEMAAFIPTLSWPAIHYKVFAAGNRSIEEGWQFLARQMRPNDMVCIGHYLKDRPDMIAENVATFEGLFG
jgi:hypothetical protein